MARATRVEAEEAPRSSLADFMRPDGHTMHALVWPMEFWLRYQSDMLKALEPLAGHWLQRRREGLEAAVNAVERIAAAPNLADGIAAQHAWIDGAMQRLGADLKEMSGPAMLWSERAVAAVREVSHVSAEATRWNVRRDEKAAASA